ncbi:YcgJ family protein [Photobacterium ganghwense]|uniref:YcgJ family protein n=1 Tax=Photobacterium ganghwense TaxID=320778 RepID=UPI004055D504
MKILPLLLLQIALFVGFGWVQATPELGGSVYSPDKGVICDKVSGFCVDQYGISMGFTNEFLGQDAETKLMEKINQAGTEKFDAARYTFSNSVYCDSEQRTCFEDYDSDNLASDYIQILFPE